MEIDLYITRDTSGGLISRGLGNVFVWFHEPCLNVSENGTDMFSLDDSLHKSLQGILYSKNCHHNFIYRSDNEKKSDFGDKLIRNDDGIDFPEELVKLYNERKLRFDHVVFGDGPKVSYQRNSVGNLFGYENEISERIWKLVCNEWDEDINMRAWTEENAKRPWYLFCKKIKINVSLIDTKPKCDICNGPITQDEIENIGKCTICRNLIENAPNCKTCNGSGRLIEKGGIEDHRYHCLSCSGTGKEDNE